MIDAGLRRSEIVGLRLCDVDRELALQANRSHLLDLVPVPNYVSAIIGASCALNWLRKLLRVGNNLVSTVTFRPIFVSETKLFTSGGFVLFMLAYFVYEFR